MKLTREQGECAERINAAMIELLSLDVRDYDRQDHINHARELLKVRDQGGALALEAVGDDANLEQGYAGQLMESSIDLHLRLAEAMR
jgi:hypothetical protein